MELIERLKKVLKSYRDGAHQDLLDDLMPVLTELVNKAVQAEMRSIVGMELRDLEDLLTVVRELKDNYDSLPEKTGQHMIKMDELRQLEYKLTEVILNNRN